MELIIFVGLQASGKSTFYHSNLAATHVHVSKDLMTNARNKDVRQIELISAALRAGKSVVVDNTSPTPFERAPLITLARRFGARVSAYFFEAAVRDAVARNRLREGRARVPDVAILMTARKIVPPSIEEGFDEVRVIAPIPVTAP